MVEVVTHHVVASWPSYMASRPGGMASTTLAFLFSCRHVSTKPRAEPTVAPGSKAKPNAHSLCAQELSLHTYHIENGYRRTNVTI
jgi:hypothetical protein